MDSPTPIGYSVSANAYLSRAKAALMTGKPEALFYAALELRCCIETRQAEYAEALIAYKGTRIKPWNIGDIGKKIRKASNADRIALMRYDFGELKLESYHTPVSDGLVKFAERELGPLLHCQSEYRKSDDKWWDNVRENLLGGYRMAWLACKGDSLTPPLWDQKTKQVHPVTIQMSDENTLLFQKLPTLPGTTFNVEIRYLKTPPSHWQCDL